MLNDSHCHFFSSQFFTALSRQRGRKATRPARCARNCSGTTLARRRHLADRWVQELDAHGVARSALIASVPATRRRWRRPWRGIPGRFVGFFMVDPSAEQAVDRVTHAVTTLGAASRVPVPRHASRGARRPSRRTHRRGRRRPTRHRGVRALRRAVGRRAEEARPAKPIRSEPGRSAEHHAPRAGVSRASRSSCRTSARGCFAKR